jgi:flagellar motor switch protein FliM
VTLFGVEQLHGVGVMDVRLPLTLAMADRLLGGKGRAPADERPLTEIEMALLEDVMQIFVSCWADLWAGEGQHFQARIIGHETSGRGLQTAAGDAAFVVLTSEMTIGETSGQIQVGVPFSMIELSVRKLEQAHHLGGEEKRAKPVQWRKHYAGISVPILAEWKVREMPLAETLRISRGDIIELPGALINQARLRLSEVETYIGTVGIQNGHVAVQITGSGGND